MKLLKQNVTISGEWTDGEYSGKFEAETNEGFWAKGKFTASSDEGHVTGLEFDKWESGYVDSENNEFTLSESMDHLLASKITSYIKGYLV